jgi:hypothetical protein
VCGRICVGLGEKGGSRVKHEKCACICPLSYGLSRVTAQHTRLVVCLSEGGAVELGGVGVDHIISALRALSLFASIDADR